MSQYGVEIDLTNMNTSHTQVIDLVGQHRRVLDVGCWTGELGRVLLGRGCTVSGIEVDPAAAAIASSHGLEPLVVADLDRSRPSDHFEPGSFDVVVLADVLEHLMDPVGVLADVATLLAPGGYVVLSLPNVTHGSVRLALLQGRWTYTETGLLDRTHIRFFNRERVADLVAQSGYEVLDLRSTVADPLRVEVEVAPASLPPTVVEWVRHQDDAMTYQFVLKCVPVGVTASSALPLPALVPAVAEDEIRLRDIYHQQVVEEVDVRHRLLTLRDHVIGLEATASVARHRAAQAEELGDRLQRRLDRKNENITRLRRRLERLENRVPSAPAGPAPAAPPAAPPTPWRRVGRRLRRSMTGRPGE